MCPNPSRILIGIPAYNEAPRIGAVVAASLPYGPVVVVDDGSTDLTAYTALKAGAAVVRFPHNAGKGVAVAALFDEARRRGVETLVLVDGDGQHDPGQIPAVAAPCLAGAADLVVGSRFLSLKSVIPLHRSLGQRAFNLMTAWATGVACSDSQSGFRAFGRRALVQMRLGEAGLSVECEQQFECRRHRLRLAEVPITCTYAVPEKRSAWRHGGAVLRRLLAMTIQRRTLRRVPIIALPDAIYAENEPAIVMAAD